MTATDPISVTCDECASWYPHLPTCADPECGCGYCEGERAEREDHIAPFAKRVSDAKRAGIRYVVAPALVVLLAGMTACGPTPTPSPSVTPATSVSATSTTPANIGPEQIEPEPLPTRAPQPSQHVTFYPTTEPEAPSND